MARAAEPVVTFSSDLTTPVDSLIQAASATLSSAPVRRDLALSVPAVLRGRNLFCAIATLPLVTRSRDQVVVASALLGQIDRNVPNVVTLAQTVEDLLFDSVSWWRVTERDANGWPRYAQHLDVDTVSLNPPADSWRRQNTLPSGTQSDGVVWVSGEEVPARDMIRFDSPNPPLRVTAARTIRRALLLEQAAIMYAQDPRPTDYFAPVEGADPANDDEIREILDGWQEARRARTTGYVPAALQYHTVSTPSPADLQLAELQKQTTIDLANTLGLDAEDLQVSTTSRTYTNAVDRRRDRINDVLSMYMRAITDRLSMNDVSRRGQLVEWDLDDYLRADPLTRWQTYEIGLRNQAISVPEVRQEERLPAIPVEGRPAPRPRPQPTPQPKEAAMSRPGAQFSDEDDTTTRITFALSTESAQFRVDRATRTVSGLMLPWNKVARSGFAKWRFSPNSLTWSETSRVKLNREHDRHTAVAYAAELSSTEQGLTGSFKVARGPAGDEVLSLAEDKVLDGFSVEVEFEEDGSSWARDPDDDMVRLVSSARLVGCAITAAPAFDDARVTGVAASRTRKEKPVTQAQKATPQESPAAAPGGETTTAAFTAAVEAFTNQTGAFADAIGRLVEVQQSGEGPAAVDPTRRTAAFQVTEEPLYRFDGTRGKHDFSSDLIAAHKNNDYEAKQRAEEWVRNNFGAARNNFAVTTANVATLNPTRQRPDLYVDQLQYPTPIWDAMRKGVIEDNTPFVLPKFNAASGLVGNHTEGVEPTPGALTTTSQTITPSAVSGKVEVTREAWDQGGNPQLSTILWRQMVRAYDEALEQGAAALLEALTVTAFTLTAGVVDAALAREVKAAMAGLHFVRGGFRFRDFVLEAGLYTALAEATDETGRSMFPVVGPQNADGSMGALFGSLNIAGLAGHPAWALPYTPAAPNDSYLFNREDVHGWASMPQRLDFEYRLAFVDIGIWGYKAFACTRTDGVRKFIYDEAA
ncbi:phage portal protein [Actinokineospora spheciospongiae]|uniref:phage portal protein n=1 Tax=Actinokineospora spheciospongiae TaxID=909613 RepID=UPI000D8C3A05|nr:phage portal protein [Actinokineospora spheciospongiae]PWW50260.1 HK97 family phage prohead protease [Actinokineospora spheciospongiae]